MFKNKRLLVLSFVIMMLAGLLLGLKAGYPHHRLLALLVWLTSWVPLAMSYLLNRRLLRIQKVRLKKKVRPWRAHTIMAILLLTGCYICGVLIPAETSPLTSLSDTELREDITADTGNYRMLRQAADDLLDTLTANQLLSHQVDELSPDQRNELRRLWRDGVMAFLECDLLKEKYRGFYQIDYLVKPALHADAFFLAYAAYIMQYDACLQIIQLVGENEFMERLLNEESPGIPGDSYYAMKQRLTHPKVMLRLNAGSAYYELVKSDITLDPLLKADFEQRRTRFYSGMGRDLELFLDNPLDVLEQTAFSTLLPVQKNVAVHMSYVRTTQRDYFITPEILATCRTRLKPGDILVERRNWHMTNIGIPGFWPHTALFVGTLEDIARAFPDSNALETIRTRHPDVYSALQQLDPEGHPRCILEAIRPGVILQSLEKSAHCDYLAAIRPELTQQEKFQFLLNAFSHYGKPYDLNFDFSTDNELVCSELVYKSIRPVMAPILQPEVTSGRLLLAPNRMVEQIATQMQSEAPAFSFVLFLDSSEKEGRVFESTREAFETSWSRPKWDVLQK